MVSSARRGSARRIKHSHSSNNVPGRFTLPCRFCSERRMNGRTASSRSVPSAGQAGGALKQWTLYGTLVQLAMVIAGHWIEPIRDHVFAVGGMAISAAAAALYARAAGLARGRSALYGAVVGGVCALVGIAVSVGLNNTPPIILLVGTASSAATGAIGGAIAGGAG